MTDPAEPTVLARRHGRIGLLTLNRPKALNALDGVMIQLIASALSEWRDDPSIHAVAIEGIGGRAFCAGGDVRDIRSMAINGNGEGIERFFAAEYALNLAIARFPKPYIALIDGICMGGGVGLSIHGGIRVATEAALFAMPETAIGLFPDVGASYALPRLRGDWGMYLALTGARLAGADAVWTGFATHYVPRAGLAALIEGLASEGPAVLAEAAVPPPTGPAAGLDLSAFAEESVPAIMARLSAMDTDWARETLATMRHVSPSSLLWSFELLRRGAGRTLEQCLEAELALTRTVTRHPDFAEGVRAMLVDKDRSPKWSPARVEDVDPSQIAAMM